MDVSPAYARTLCSVAQDKVKDLFATWCYKVSEEPFRFQDTGDNFWYETAYQALAPSFVHDLKH